MKRISIILLSIILLSQILTGCSNKTVKIDSEEADYDVTISYEPKYDEDTAKIDLAKAEMTIKKIKRN